MDWLPIESAPKDGEDILLAGRVGQKMRLKVGIWHANAWAVAITRSGAIPNFEHPTHWMPLPLPPQAAKE